MARKAKDKKVLFFFFSSLKLPSIFGPVWCVCETMLFNSKSEFHFADFLKKKKNVRRSNATELLRGLQKPKMHTLQSSKDSVCQPLVKVKVKLLSHVLLFATSIHGISQARVVENCLGLPFPSPGHLPDPRIEPRSPALLADAFTVYPWYVIKYSCFRICIW